MQLNRRSLAAQRGVGLIDALIALAILAFGMLALTQMQTRVTAATTESNARLTATQIADELVSMALVDPNPANAGCYTFPIGACTNANAQLLTEAWELAARNRLPGAVAGDVVSTYDAPTGQLSVTLRWTGKGSTEQRSLTLVTDIRP